MNVSLSRQFRLCGRRDLSVFTETPTPCITVTVTNTTTPNLAQLIGTRFGVGAPLGPQEYGKCEPAKHGYFSDSVCLHEDVKKGKPKGGGRKGKKAPSSDEALLF